MKNLKNKTFTLLFSFVSIFSYSQHLTDKENIKELEKSAKNSPEAQRALAEYYCNNLDYDKISYGVFRYDKAYKWFLKAAENNDAKSQYRVASMYKTGDGIEKDKQKMWFWLSKSAENGFAVAQLGYAWFFCNYDNNQNPQKQEYWLKKAAEQDYQPAQFYLAQFYQHGQSTLSEEINTDKSKALLWYLKVAQSNLYVKESGYGDITDNNDYVRQAQNRLGIMYFKGEGTNIDVEKAIFWSTKSIEKLDAGMTLDIAYSMINLGDVYFYLKDFDKALYWYNTELKSPYGSSSDKEKILEVEKAIASRKEEADAKSQGKEVLAELYKKRQEETEEKNRLNEQRDKAQEEFTKRINAEWDANAAKSKAMDAAVAKAHREAQKENKSFIQELIPELQKTEQAVSRKIKENDAAFRGTTVEAENEKAQRDAAFYAASERLGFDTFNTSGTTSSSNSSSSNTSNNSSLSNGDNSSNSSSNSSSGNSDSKSKTASSNDTNTKNNNSGTTSNNSLSSNTGTSNSSSGTTPTNVSNGSNSSKENSSSKPNSLYLTDMTDYKYIAKQKQEQLEIEKALKNRTEDEIKFQTLSLQDYSDYKRAHETKKTTSPTVKAKVGEGNAVPR